MSRHKSTPEEAEQKEWLNFREAGELVGKHRNTIGEWAKHGLVRVYRGPGNAYPLIKREEFLKLFRASALIGEEESDGDSNST